MSEYNPTTLNKALLVYPFDAAIKDFMEQVKNGITTLEEIMRVAKE